MAKHVMLGTAGSNFVLHSDEHLSVLEERFRKAAQSGETIDVDVDLNPGGDPSAPEPRGPRRITVNPKALGWWAFFELS